MFRKASHEWPTAILLATLLAGVLTACEDEDVEQSCARMLASGSYNQICTAYRMDGGTTAHDGNGRTDGTVRPIDARPAPGAKCSMKFGTCKSADDCTCGASCGVTSVCSTCSKRCVFYCETNADCVKRTAHLLTPLLNCNQTSSSGIKVCE